MNMQIHFVAGDLKSICVTYILFQLVPALYRHYILCLVHLNTFLQYSAFHICYFHLNLELSFMG